MESLRRSTLDARLWTAFANPHQHPPIFINGQPLGLYDFRREVCQVVIIDLQSTLQRTIGDPSITLEQHQDLFEMFVKRHHFPSPFAYDTSTWLSRNRASPLSLRLSELVGVV